MESVQHDSWEYVLSTSCMRSESPGHKALHQQTTISSLSEKNNLIQLNYLQPDSSQKDTRSSSMIEWREKLDSDKKRETVN